MPTSAAFRILHITKRFTPDSSGGGVERYIHHLARNHAAQGHEVSVIAHKTAPDSHAPYTILLPSLRRLSNAICTADCVHLHGPRTPYAALGGILCILTGTPFVYTAHCFYRGDTRAQRIGKLLWDQTIERLLFATARSVILLSPYWCTMVAQKYLPMRRISILPNGVDVAALQAEPFTSTSLEGAPAILMVSRLDPVKRIDDAIHALTQPNLANAHLHIVGTGADAARLQAILDGHPAASRVTFHGFKTDAQVAAMARAAQVFVIASAEEGMPTTILEMLARRLPVVASDIPGNRSLLDPLHWPHYYPVGDSAALASCILHACDSTLSESVLTPLAAQFDWPALAGAMFAQYRAV